MPWPKTLHPSLLLTAALLLVFGACDSRHKAQVAADDFLAAVRDGRDADACALVWSADENPAKCDETIKMIRPPIREGLVVDSVSVYANGAGAHVHLHVVGGRRIDAHMICSCNRRESRPGPDCPWYLNYLR
ncbi:MAG TPA: hypothetical protein PK156_20415 [Polyangium sp.]|nr:hypothetical protein [Polyangium sp.]